MCKILIVGDDKKICDTYSDSLKYSGHNIHVLNSAMLTLRVLPQLVPDIVLLDFQMPSVAGMFTLSFIRRLPHLAHTKVIIISFYPVHGESAQSMWGANMLLVKPVASKQLIEAISIYS